MKLKRILVGILVSTMFISLLGCDKRKDKELDIGTNWYINTSDTVTINTFNGNKLVESNVEELEDGKIRVELIFDKPIKQ